MSMTGLRRLWQEVTRVRKLPCYHVLSGLLYVVVLSANTTGFKRILWSFAITKHSHAWWILKVACFSQSQYVRVGGWVVQSIQWGQSQWNRLWLSLERLGAPSRQHQRLDPTEKWVLWGASPLSNRPCRPGKKIKSLSRLFWYPTPMVLFWHPNSHGFHILIKTITKVWWFKSHPTYFRPKIGAMTPSLGHKREVFGYREAVERVRKSTRTQSERAGRGTQGCGADEGRISHAYDCIWLKYSLTGCLKKKSSSDLCALWYTWLLELNMVLSLLEILRS